MFRLAHIVRIKTDYGGFYSTSALLQVCLNNAGVLRWLSVLAPAACLTSPRESRNLGLALVPWCAPHGFIKKTQKTPDAELKLARRRMREFK